MNTEGTQTADRTRQILDGLGDGILCLDEDWRVIDCNAPAQSLLECSRQDLLGRNVWKIAGLATDGAFGKLAQRVARTRMPEDAEIICPGRDRERLVQVRVFSIGQGIGAPGAWVRAACA